MVSPSVAGVAWVCVLNLFCVCVPEFLVDEVRTHILWLKQEKLKLGKPGIISILFADPKQDGQPYSQRKIQTAIKKVCLKAGIAERSPHDLRHTYGVNSAFGNVARSGLIPSSRTLILFSQPCDELLFPENKRGWGHFLAMLPKGQSISSTCAGVLPLVTMSLLRFPSDLPRAGSFRH